MSTFIHGGSGLVLDIAGKAHAELDLGDVVQINPLVTATESGYTTQVPDALNTCVSQVSLFGVVLGSNGKSKFALGEDVLIRVVGICKVNIADTASGIGQGVKLRASAMTAEGTAGTAVVLDASGVKLCAVAHTAGTGLQTVFFNGMTSWG
jgi:hypothetical protein